RAGAARAAQLLDLGGRLAAREPLLVALAVALDGDDQLLAERVDHRGADAVQAARDLVVAAAGGLAARVQQREDHLEGALLVLGHVVDGDAAAVVVDRDGLAVVVQGHQHLGRVLVDDLVDRVVDDLPQQVVVAGLAGAADVHGGAAADRLEALEDLDLGARVLLRLGGRHQLPPLSPPAGAASCVITTGTGTGVSCARRDSWWPLPPRAAACFGSGCISSRLPPFSTTSVVFLSPI